MTPIRVSLWFTSDDQELIARAAELFARAGAGLGLDGAEVMLTIGPNTDEEDETP